MATEWLDVYTGYRTMFPFSYTSLYWYWYLLQMHTTWETRMRRSFLHCPDGQW